MKKTVVTMIFAFMICILGTVPVCAGNKSYTETYRNILREGKITYKNPRTYYYDKEGSKQTITPEEETYQITGFRMLNVDGKGAPELLLQVPTNSVKEGIIFNDNTIIMSYKNGKAIYLTSPGREFVTFSLGTSDITRSSSEPEEICISPNYFYYNKSKKKLYGENINRNYYINANYNSTTTYKSLYAIKGNHIVWQAECEKMKSKTGERKYCTKTAYKTSTVYHSSRQYRAFEKKYFSGFKKYRFYKLNEQNILKYIR